MAAITASMVKELRQRTGLGMMDVKKALVESLCDEEDESAPAADDVKGAFSKLEKSLVREHILSGNPRIDGRDLSTVRPISVECGVLPRAHGSALFTRGETQAIVATTLGTGRDAQIIDAIDRDPRHRTISVVHSVEQKEQKPVKGNDDAAQAKWFSIDDLPEMAFDHADILADFFK